MHAKAALERITTAASNLKFLMENSEATELSDKEKETISGFALYRERFIAAMDDDFNTADAVSVIFELVREINSAATSDMCPSKALAKASLDILNELIGVLGLIYGETEDKGISVEVEALIEARQAARKAKNWAESDRIRDELKNMGIVIEDTPQGAKIVYIK